MLKFFFALSNFELTSRISTQSRPKIKKANLSNKNKQKRTPKDTQLNVSTFIDLVKNDLNKEKAKKKKRKMKKKNPKPNMSKG